MIKWLRSLFTTPTVAKDEPLRFTDDEMANMKRAAPGLHRHIINVRKFEAEKRKRATMKIIGGRT